MPIPSDGGGGWKSTEASLWVYRQGKDIGNSIQIPHPRRQDPTTYEVALSAHPQHSTVLTMRGPLRISVDLPGTKVPVAACLWRMLLTITPSQTPAASNSTLSHDLTSKCKHFMPNTYRGRTGHYNNYQKKIEKNMQLRRQVWRKAAVLDTDYPIWH